MNLSLLYVIMNYNDFLENMFIQNEVEYKLLFDRNGNKYIYVYHYENKNASEAFKNIVMKHIYLSEKGRLTFGGSDENNIVITSHNVSVIRNCDINNVNYFSIGEKFAVVHLLSGRKRQKEHPAFSYTMGYSTNSILMCDDRDNLYIVSKYSGEKE